mmetsp:Transcript_43537/g.85096  ORF Transcript_43537/g.85096 Transcript_43537/m.85096 type:complete len:253 (+) Transcript_43537:1252-2010(+)
MVPHHERPPRKPAKVEEKHSKQRKSLPNASSQRCLLYAFSVDVKGIVKEGFNLIFSREGGDCAHARNALGRNPPRVLVVLVAVAAGARDELHLEIVGEDHEGEGGEADEGEHPSADKCDDERDCHDGKVLDQQTQRGAYCSLYVGGVFRKLHRQRPGAVLREIEESDILPQYGGKTQLSKPHGEVLAHQAEGEELHEVGYEGPGSKPREPDRVVAHRHLHHIPAHIIVTIRAEEPPPVHRTTHRISKVRAAA